tara:strand:- start:923 stop:1108 length:186 start_codon:yes stop_codon:yes gene_type:complete
MNNINIYAFILGILTVVINNPLPHYIIKLPNLNDTYIDNVGKRYKYKLVYINDDKDINKKK